MKNKKISFNYIMIFWNFFLKYIEHINQIDVIYHKLYIYSLNILKLHCWILFFLKEML